MLHVGEAFSGSESSTLRDTISRQSARFFHAYHASNLQVLGPTAQSPRGMRMRPLHSLSIRHSGSAVSHIRRMSSDSPGGDGQGRTTLSIRFWTCLRGYVDRSG
jgi:hypothetical protein